MDLDSNIFIKENWTKNDLEILIEYLKAISNNTYNEFNKKIVNTKSTTIGIQIPKLRSMAKLIQKGNVISFLNLHLPNIFELDMLHALSLCSLKDNSIALKYFIPFVNNINNWAVCDIFCGDYRIVNKNKEYYFNYIQNNISSNSEFVVRVCVILMMKYYLDYPYEKLFVSLNNIKIFPYYVEMGVAWMLAEYYLRNPQNVLDYIKTSNLSYLTKYKAYQKMIESFRVSSENKEIIKIERSKLIKPKK